MIWLARLGALATVIGYALAPTSVFAETFAQGYVRNCPNGARLSVLSRQYERGYALLDDSRFAIAKKLAAELYDCSTIIHDPYERDVTKLFSLEYLALSSFRKDSEQLTIQFNELAANTQFADIRKMALKARDSLRSQE
jgi:hypothetical protein